MVTPRRWTALVTLTAGCTFDDWVYHPPIDATIDRAIEDRSASQDLTVLDDHTAATDATDADATSVFDAVEAADVPDAIDAPDVVDVVDATDATDVVDVPVRPPRLLRPLSGARLTGNAPTLRWDAADESVQVELCADRDCARVDRRLDARGGSLEVRDLPRGTHWWRVRPARGGVTPTWFFVSAGSARPVTRAAGFVPDFDADGYADLAAGVPRPISGASVRIYRGGPAGPAVDPDAILDDPTRGDTRFGARLACGDLDGDGFVDLVVSATSDRDGRGTVFVFAGGRGGLGATPAQRIEGAPVGGEFGDVVSVLGDVDGDGYADLAVGPFITNFVTVYRGSPTGLRLDAADVVRVSFGEGCTPALGLDEGADRDALACFTDGARAARLPLALRVFRAGDSGAPLARGTRTPLDITLDATAVRAASVMGDADGDGVVDLAVSSTGSVYVVPGGTAGFDVARAWRLRSPTEATSYGNAIAAADYDGDGRAELAVSEPDSDARPPRPVYVCLARSTSCELSSQRAMQTSVTLAYLHGAAMTAPGDLNGDGFDDAVVGGSAVSAAAAVVEVHFGGRDGPSTRPSVVIPPIGGALTAFGSAFLP